MELEHTNFNGEIVLAIDINLLKPFFFKILKIEFRNESNKLFFQ